MGIFDKKPSAPAKRSHHAKQPARTATGNSIQSFFWSPTPPPQVGRPTGPIKKRGRPPSSATGILICPEVPTTPALAAPSANTSASSASSNIPSGSSHTGVLGKRAAAQIAGGKLRRINWGEGDALLRMQIAVNDCIGTQSRALSCKTRRRCRSSTMPRASVFPIRRSRNTAVLIRASAQCSVQALARCRCSVTSSSSSP